VEALADRRQQREERQSNNQPDERSERGVTRGRGVMRGGCVGGWEAAV